MPITLSGFRTFILRSALCVAVPMAICAVGLSVKPQPVMAQASQQLTDMQKTSDGAVKDGAASQERINQYDDKTSELLGEYRAALTLLDDLREYNTQLEKVIKGQEAEMKKIRQQIEDVTHIDRNIIPHMFRMIEGLSAFVELDVPFLIEKRRDRIERLRKLMDRSDADAAEKYRKILEAFEIENEYGRTIEAYEGQMVIDGTERTVNFLRLGRVAWMYQSLDRADSAVWSQEKRDWVNLKGDFDSELRTAFRIAKEQAAPNLLIVPVFGAQEGN